MLMLEEAKEAAIDEILARLAEARRTGSRRTSSPLSMLCR
jgi:hypothetical protein